MQQATGTGERDDPSPADRLERHIDATPDCRVVIAAAVRRRPSRHPRSDLATIVEPEIAIQRLRFHAPYLHHERRWEATLRALLAILGRVEAKFARNAKPTPRCLVSGVVDWPLAPLCNGISRSF
jgi:hypothetical protein